MLRQGESRRAKASNRAGRQNGWVGVEEVPLRKGGGGQRERI